MPKGFVTLGDSVCAFNPVYGLGMTLTGLEVEELQRCLRESDGGRTLDPLTFQKGVAKLVTAPWALTTGEDLRWPATQGGEITPKVKLMHWYIDQVIRLIPESPEVYTALPGSQPHDEGTRVAVPSRGPLPGPEAGADPGQGPEGRQGPGDRARHASPGPRRSPCTARTENDTAVRPRERPGGEELPGRFVMRAIATAPEP